MNDDNDDESVGYKKPPKSGRFRKGQSGNPRGRKRKVRPDFQNETLADVLDRVGQEIVRINGEDMTLREVAIRSLYHKAAKGDVQATRHLDFLRKEVGLLKRRTSGGALLVPIMESPEHWEDYAKYQQARYREDRMTFDKLFPPEEWEHKKDGRVVRKKPS